MSEKLNKLTLLISAILMLLAVVVGGYFYLKVMSMETMPDSIILPADKVNWNMDRLGGALEVFAYLTYIYIAVIVLVTFGFSLLKVFQSKKTAINSLKSVGIIVLIFIIAYILASPKIPVFLGYEKFNLTEGVVKAIDTGLIATYLFFMIAVFGIVFTGARSLFRR